MADYPTKSPFAGLDKALLRSTQPLRPTPPPAEPNQSTGVALGERPPVSPPARASVRTDVRTPVRRTITRYAFELYYDQVEFLRELSVEQKQQGQKGSMSEMVREALDNWIDTQKREER